MFRKRCLLLIVGTALDTGLFTRAEADDRPNDERAQECAKWRSRQEGKKHDPRTVAGRSAMLCRIAQQPPEKAADGERWRTHELQMLASMGATAMPCSDAAVVALLACNDQPCLAQNNEARESWRLALDDQIEAHADCAALEQRDDQQIVTMCTTPDGIVDNNCVDIQRKERVRRLRHEEALRKLEKASSSEDIAERTCASQLQMPDESLYERCITDMRARVAAGQKKQAEAKEQEERIRQEVLRLASDDEKRSCSFFIGEDRAKELNMTCLRQRVALRLREEEAQRKAGQDEAEMAEAAPEVKRLAASASHCKAKAERAEWRETIAHEKRGAKIAGVVDVKQLHDAQENILRAEEIIANAERTLKGLHSKPLPCNDQNVMKLVQTGYCVGSNFSTDRYKKVVCGLMEE